MRDRARRPRDIAAQVATQIALAAVALFVIFPLWSLFYMAFDGSITSAPDTFRLWPKEFTLDVFQRALERPAQMLNFGELLGNSVIVSGGAALVAVVLGAGMAYAFARFRFPLQRQGVFALLVGSLLPPVALLTPLFVLLTAVGLRTQRLGLIIVYAAFAMPFCVWNMRAAFQAVPRELEESAFLDGASDLVAFRRITLPLAAPSIVVAGIVAFLAGYSEFAIAWQFVDSGDKVTLAMALTNMVGIYSVAWSLIAAVALLMSVPVMAAFVLLQRQLTRGLLFGVTDA